MFIGFMNTYSSLSRSFRYDERVGKAVLMKYLVNQFSGVRLFHDDIS
jgi:hypothetical protein